MKIYLSLFFFSFSVLCHGQIIEEDASGTHAPNFTFELLAGEYQNLASLKGEVVYISFWASWCKPCLQGFEKYKSIREEMEKMGVVLLNISIDQSEEKWKEAVEQYNIQGIHGLTPKNDLLADYQLYSVPRYEIVGKNGEFLYLDRENGKSVMANFEAFLNAE